MKKNQFIHTIYAGEGKVLHRIEDRPFIDKSRSEVYRNPLTLIQIKQRVDSIISTNINSKPTV